MRPSAATAAQWAIAKKAYLEGATGETAAGLIGVRAGTLHARARREGWSRKAQASRPSGAVAAATPGAGAPGEETIDGAPLSWFDQYEKALFSFAEAQAGGMVWPRFDAGSLDDARAIVEAPLGWPDLERVTAQPEVTVQDERIMPDGGLDGAPHPLAETPGYLAAQRLILQALNGATLAVRAGDGLEALRLARAAREIIALEQRPRPVDLVKWKARRAADELDLRPGGFEG
ncbi:hypothetical protein [Brevundimonas sp.]|uniref:hypothetical protein n=1 Tax=Brevundimonas sp. TaxID=1871086 RepID=UPI0035AE23F0